LGNQKQKSIMLESLFKIKKTNSILQEQLINTKLNNLKIDSPPKLKKKIKNLTDIENDALINNYGKQSFHNFRKRELKEIYPELLKSHQVSSFMRTKMVDWMFEVFNAYECAVETYFLAVYTIDKFLNNTKMIINNNNFHLIGVTCIHIATKFEDVFPLNAYKIECLAFNRFTM